MQNQASIKTRGITEAIQGIVDRSQTNRDHKEFKKARALMAADVNTPIADYYGVSLVFMRGGLAVTKEAKALNPDIETVDVKEAVSRRAAKCLHPQKARQLIKETVTKSLKKRKTIPPFIFKPPIEFNIKHTNAGMADAVEFMPSAKRMDGTTIRFVLDAYLEAFGAFRASIYIAFAIDL